jgi:hypothetical protein
MLLLERRSDTQDLHQKMKKANKAWVEDGPKRPMIVTIVCGFLLFGFICLPTLFATAYSQSSLSWHAKYNIAHVILQGVFTIGMLRMKRWGFIGFFALVAANLAIGQWNLLVIKHLLMLVFVGGICYLLYRAMPRRSQSSEQGTDGKPPEADQPPHNHNPNTRLP